MWLLKATKPCATTKEFLLKSYRQTCRYKFNSLVIFRIYCFTHAKLLQKSEMRKDIVIELSYKGFG